MQLKDFLDYPNLKDFLHKKSVVVFCASDDTMIPIVFVSQWIQFLKSQNYPIESLNLMVGTPSDSISQLETSFLGMGLIYWLRGLQEIDKKYRQTILEYIAGYKGPHTIIICVSQEDAVQISAQEMIVVPQVVNSELFVSLLAFFKKKNTAHIQKNIHFLCQAQQKISLDQACMAIAYMQVMGKYEDCVSLFKQIFESEKSLFVLSQYFFAKDSVSFFKAWEHFESDYSPAFWSVFWSEQLWRAYHAHYFLARQQQQQAKSIGYRLPFSYLQKDWKKVTLVELKNAHQFMYELDRNFKNGVEAPFGLDLLYTKFFLGEFSA